MNKSLESVQWGEFVVSEIFKITNSKPYHKNHLQVGKGKTPYITRTSFNNGLENIVENENFALNPKDTISLGAENTDFFYQGIEYITGNKIYYLSNQHINRYIGLFIVQILRTSVKNCGFGFGKGLTGTRLHNRKIMLPIDSKGNPHWGFMESFMRKLEQKHLQKIIKYYENKLLNSNGGGQYVAHFVIRNLYLVTLSETKYPKDITNNPAPLQQIKTLQLSLRVA